MLKEVTNQQKVVLVLLTLVLLNILSVIDKILTYIGIHKGFDEFNPVMGYMFNVIGLIPSLILLSFGVLYSSYFVFDKFKNTIMYFKTKMVIFNSFNLIYAYFIINNIRWLSL